MEPSLYDGVCELYMPNQGEGITTRNPIGWHNARAFPSPLMSLFGARRFGSNRLNNFVNKPNWTSQTNNYESAHFAPEPVRNCHWTSTDHKLQDAYFVSSITLCGGRMGWGEGVLLSNNEQRKAHFVKVETPEPVKKMPSHFYGPQMGRCLSCFEYTSLRGGWGLLSNNKQHNAHFGTVE